MISHSIPARALRVTLLLLLTGLSACVQPAPVEPAMNNNPLLTNPRPWCIGRLVMDRPAPSKLASESYEYWGDKIEIATNVTPGTFKSKVEAREKELRTQKRTTSISYKEMREKGLKSMDVETDTSWLEQAASPTQTSRLLIYKKFADRVDSLFYAEGYVLAGNTFLTMRSLVSSGDVQKFTQLSTDEYRYITYRDDWAVPTERGFCIKGALIGGASRNSEEIQQVFMLMPGRPATFVVDMRSAVDVDQQSSLLKTLPDLRRKLRDQGLTGSVRVLREGKRQFAGMDAEEVLFSIKDGNVQVFKFYLMAPGNHTTTAQPHAEIQLELGSEPYDGLPPDRATSPVDEAGAIQAWDTVLNSFRLRPGAM